MTTTIAAQPAPRISWVSVLYIGAIHVAALLAVFRSYFSWSGLALCLLLHWITGGIGICLIYHRLLTHRSFTFRPKWLDYPFAILGCMASEGGPIGWVADHRRHHAHSDEELDVHTPHEGFFWAHMGWFMVVDEDSRHTPEYFQKWAPDLYADPILRWIEKYFIAFPLALFVGLYAAGQWYNNVGMSWLVWGGFIRTVFVWHTTWLVNSATHVWGYRSHTTRDDSTNLWWVALLTYGEGWHNNHHAFQTSARHGLAWWEIDLTYITIRSMQMMGIVYNIKLPKLRKASGPMVSVPSIAPVNPGFGLLEEAV
jgi:stearoyl-CoA desaturase (delta-9 desaturase)